ncbi:LLM class flavin-dependent oxidoreductase [Microbacterium sp. SYP-A9085]|uniref:LLM class flavin-dependent oxidoreductase n=1 Tax=Microbacterium sp. SYP-A9085 TaxID=2664454 RepID=UPI00129B29BD|nr:LLM class flavin-dependent oxidoreductase [Microbacterium sp. SYP-A9085]MRH29873.1 LLM class flavin-dependent oxidoreductase [Microbacterium sp. SYP-A9085]
MRFGLIMENETPRGTTHEYRYHELVREVQKAEDVGFDFWGGSEQHFYHQSSTTSQPLVFYAYVAAKTHTIKLRSQIVLALPKVNDPIRLAEAVNTVDILSKGRFELGLGRGNSPTVLDTFGVDAKETREQMLEFIEAVAGLLASTEPFEYHGKHIDFPPAMISPRGAQHPHPPIYMVATSAESHKLAAERGLGCISSDNWLGMDVLYEPIKQYREEILNPSRPVSSRITNGLCYTMIPAYCAPTKREAVETGGPIALSYLGRVSKFTYGNLAKRSKDFAYMGEVGNQLGGLYEDQDVVGLMNRTPQVMLGDPDDFIESIKTLESLGYDEVTMRIEGMGHEKVMRSLDLIGRYVIPEFTRPGSVVRGQYGLPDPVEAGGAADGQGDSDQRMGRVV